MIHDGAYMIGYGAPETIGFGCNVGGTYDCIMAPIPSGPSAANRTKIVGEGYTGSCISPIAKLWGTGMLSAVLNMKSSSHVEVSCLDISDHASCVNGPGHPDECDRSDFANLLSADTGILAVDSVDVKLTNLNVHGLASAGIIAGRLTDWYMNKVRLAANGLVGWSGDTSFIGPCSSNEPDGPCSSNSGVIEFKNSLFEWNGCVEKYDSLEISGCFNDSAQGYGDGLGTGYTSGAWSFLDTSFVNNVGDGLDMLYAKAPGASVAVNRVYAAHNARNAIKIGGNGSIKNSVIFGDCGFFEFKTFTYNAYHCRAGGAPIALTLVRAADRMLIYNNTLVSQGSSMVTVAGENSLATGAVLKLRNNIFVAQPYYLYKLVTTGDIYNVSPAWIAIDDDFNIKETINGLASCTGNSNLCSGVSGYAGLVSATLTSVNAHTVASSPARNSGVTRAVDPAVPSRDYQNIARGVGPGSYIDRGAIEEQ